MRPTFSKLLLGLAMASTACSGDASKPAGPKKPDYVTVLGCETALEYAIGDEVWDTVDGACRGPGGDYTAHYYRFSQTSPGRVRIFIEAYFDDNKAIIGLADAEGNYLDFDMTAYAEYYIGDYRYHGWVTADLPVGTYVIMVANADGGGSPFYRLTSDRYFIEHQTITTCTTSVSHSLGSSVTGELATTDCRTNTLSYVDLHEITIAAEQSVTISLEGSFDTFLVLFDSGGRIMAYSNDSGGTLNSALTRTLPQGTYRIGVMSNTRDATGSYTLTTH